MQRLLVTGGAGFIGSNFVHHVINTADTQNDEFRITVLDSLTYAGSLANLGEVLKSGRVEFVRGDVRDMSIVKELVHGSDAVIHFAAESHVDRSISDPGIFIDTNVKGTHNLLEASKQFSKRMVLISTDEVYGSLATGFAKEEDAINPSSPYSASKASADLLATAYHRTYGLDVVITRCSNNYGPRQYPEKLIPMTIKKILATEKIPVYGNGSNIRDWIHVEDHCEGIRLALTKGTSGRIYNFGDVDQISNVEIVRQLLTIMNESTELIEFVTDRLGHDFRYAIDASRAKNELGWSAKKSLQLDLPNVVEWYIKH